MIEEQIQWYVRIKRDQNGPHEVDGVRYMIEEKGSFLGEPDARLDIIETAIRGFRDITIPKGQCCFEYRLELTREDSTKDN